MPSVKANSVSSLPLPTFLPGCHFVPLCLTRILPALTTSPEPTLMPKRFDSDSRLLRVDPCPFLCAMLSFLRLLTNPCDFHTRLCPSKAPFFGLVMAGLIFETDSFWSFNLANDFTVNVKIGNKGLTYMGF